jgi:CRISPR system Cascade subunit CasE
MSLYLSRLILNPRSRQVMGEIAHPYEMHRTLMRAFPKATDDTQAKARDEFGVLFRADVDERRGVVKVYVQSNVPPDWSFLDGLDDYLLRGTGMPEHEFRDVMEKFEKTQSGQILSFRLRANPTKRNARKDMTGEKPDPLKGKRVELQREDEQVAWLVGKGRGGREGVPGGFELLMEKGEDAEGREGLIPRVNVCCEGKQTGRKRDASAGHAMTHLAVVFDGLLRVTDRDAFVETLVRGIGSGKAYGFGLLSVAPARE